MEDHNEIQVWDDFGAERKNKMAAMAKNRFNMGPMGKWFFYNSFTMVWDIPKIFYRKLDLLSLKKTGKFEKKNSHRVAAATPVTFA